MESYNKSLLIDKLLTPNSCWATIKYDKECNKRALPVLQFFKALFKG